MPPDDTSDEVTPGLKRELPSRVQIDAYVRARDEHYAATPYTADCRRKGEEHKRAYLEIDRAFPGWIETNLPDKD